MRKPSSKTVSIVALILGAILGISAIGFAFLPGVIVSSASNQDMGLTGLSFTTEIGGAESLFGGAFFPVIGMDYSYNEYVLGYLSGINWFGIASYLILIGSICLSFASLKDKRLCNWALIGMFVSTVLILIYPVFFYVHAGLTDVTHFTFKQTKVYKGLGNTLSTIASLCSFISLFVYSTFRKGGNEDEEREF